MSVAGLFNSHLIMAAAVQHAGTEEQKQFFLPRIAAGKCIFAVGYTEAGSGTDLASLKMPADLDGDEYVVSGNKLFTSSGQDCDYIWLAVRTDKDVKRPSDGISILIASGVSLETMKQIDSQLTMRNYEGFLK